MRKQLQATNTKVFRLLKTYGKYIDRLAPVLLVLTSIMTYVVGGEKWLLAAAILLPILYMALNSRKRAPSINHTGISNMNIRETLESHLEYTLENIFGSGSSTALFFLQIDDFGEILDRFGEEAAEQVISKVSTRIRTGLRDVDMIARAGKCRLAIALDPVRHIDLEICIQLATRLQTAVEDPVKLDSTVIYASCSVGFCMSNRVSRKSVAGLISAAETALDEAHRAGPSAIRSYSESMQHRTSKRETLYEDVRHALVNGQIQAWFQPQISTDTGAVTGFEALARWEHPQNGTIPPSDFIEALEQTGQLAKLAETMLHQSLTALKAWDDAGFQIPKVGVNFAGDELRDPSLIDKVKWQLDRFGVPAERLAIEVLETVVVNSPDDTIARNINGLAALGCIIDLDDFGTGHTSISSIRRFAVSRLKIDRSFVTKSDQDPEQQRVIAAIITMAESLGMETLAEGAETAGEHAILAQLGCNHVQGFGIARPMPYTQTIPWMQKHKEKLQAPPVIGRQTGS